MTRFNPGDIVSGLESNEHAEIRTVKSFGSKFLVEGVWAGSIKGKLATVSTPTPSAYGLRSRRLRGTKQSTSPQNHTESTATKVTLLYAVKESSERHGKIGRIRYHGLNGRTRTNILSAFVLEPALSLSKGQWYHFLNLLGSSIRKAKGGSYDSLVQLSFLFLPFSRHHQE